MTTPDPKPLIAPCPWDGCAGELRSWPLTRDVMRYQVYCSNCEGTTGNALRGFETEKDAIAEWNRRPHSGQTPAGVRAAAEAAAQEILDEEHQRVQWTVDHVPLPTEEEWVKIDAEIILKHLGAFSGMAWRPGDAEPVAYGITWDGQLNDAFFARKELAEAVRDCLQAEAEDRDGAHHCGYPEIKVMPLYAAAPVTTGWRPEQVEMPDYELLQRILYFAIKAAEKENGVHLMPRDEEDAEAFLDKLVEAIEESRDDILNPEPPPPSEPTGDEK